MPGFEGIAIHGNSCAYQFESTFSLRRSFPLLLELRLGEYRIGLCGGSKAWFLHIHARRFTFRSAQSFFLLQKARHYLLMTLLRARCERRQSQIVGSPHVNLLPCSYSDFQGADQVVD